MTFEQKIMKEKTMNVREVIIALGTLVESESHHTYERDGKVYPITDIRLKADLRNKEDRKALETATQLLLENNEVNRPLDKHYVEYWVGEIIGGRWKNGLSIMKFATHTPNGGEKIILIAGQHRLTGFRNALKYIEEEPWIAAALRGSIQIDLEIGHPLEDAPDDNRVKPGTPGQAGLIDQKIYGTELNARPIDFTRARVVLLGPGAASDGRRYFPSTVSLDFLRPYLPNTRLVDKAVGIEGFNASVQAVLLRWTAQPDFDLGEYMRFIEVARTHLGDGEKEYAPIALTRYLDHLDQRRRHGLITRKAQWIASYNAAEIAVRYFIGETPIKKFGAKKILEESWRKELFPLPMDESR